MNYVILNGKKSTLIKGLLIQSLPPISKPLIRSSVEEIDGRDGDIVTTLGYSAYDKPMSIGLFGDFDINEVIQYFDSKGTVIFQMSQTNFIITRSSTRLILRGLQNSGQQRLLFMFNHSNFPQLMMLFLFLTMS